MFIFIAVLFFSFFSGGFINATNLSNSGISESAIQFKGTTENGQASLTLRMSGMALCLADQSTVWELTKTGSYDPDTKILTWNIAATKSSDPTIKPMLTAYGVLVITNTGSAPATIGNIVVNLQKSINNKWVSYSADVANATYGDTAVQAKISPTASSENISTFNENIYSGNLNFTDSLNNSLFYLTPQKVIGIGETMELDFSASFDPSALGVPTGGLIRIEVIVSFGNSGARGGSGASSQKVDINGNGIIDPDEKYVRSVPVRTSLTLPPMEICNNKVQLLDPSSSISGFYFDDQENLIPSPFSNFQTNIGGGSGIEEIESSVNDKFVSIQVDDFEKLRIFSNYAELFSPDTYVQVIGPLDPFGNPLFIKNFVCCNGISKNIYSTVEVPGIAENSNYSSWQEGDFCTFAQGGYASPGKSTPGTIRDTYFATTFPTPGVLIGLAKPSYHVSINYPSTVSAFLKSNKGTPGQLTATLDPLGNLSGDKTPAITTSAGVFASHTLSLALNIGFDAAGYSGKAPSNTIKFGNLVLCNLPSTSIYKCLEGKSVKQILAIANTFLSIGSSPISGCDRTFTISEISDLVDSLNQSFDNCTLGDYSKYLC